MHVHLLVGALGVTLAETLDEGSTSLDLLSMRLHHHFEVDEPLHMQDDCAQVKEQKVFVDQLHVEHIYVDVFRLCIFIHEKVEFRFGGSEVRRKGLGNFHFL